MNKIICILLFLLSGLTAWAQEYGIVTVSVCSMRSAADFSSEMQTQALMGTPVKILADSSWYRIQTPDTYLGWVHHAGVHAVSREELHAWNVAEKVIVTSHYGWVYSQPSEKSQPVSDVVSGDRLRLTGTKGKFFCVTYPDGRTGYLPKALAKTEAEWRRNLKQDAQSIIATAHSLMGVPYLWAGMSSKGMDCSGFMRTVLFMHDIIIPRDAGPQSRKGDRMEIAPDCSNLIPGDLVFFGHKATADTKERVVHVGMYIGNQRFIHSQGDVHVGSLNPNDELFDAYNLGRLLFATRFLPYVGRDPELNSTLTNEFYRY